uniref:Complement C8 gamma chain n=1 Tax=Strigops habroptila TaxID=2489341 RepID=A0A672U9D9_STRHB
MVSRGALLLLGLLLAAPPGLGQGPGRRRRPPPPQSPLEKVAAPLAGRWFLVGMASRCGFLAEHSHRLEATAVTVTVGDRQSLDVSTFRKLDGGCWMGQGHCRQVRARRSRGHGSKVDVVVGETDHSSYAILYFQKGRSISVKLYGRSSRVSDAVIDKFEQHLRAVGLSEDVTYYFPAYGFCDTADEFHILDGELWGPGGALGPPMGPAWPHVGHHMGSPALAGSWAQWARPSPHHGCVVLSGDSRTGSL